MVRSFHQVDDTERRLVKNNLKEKITWGKIQKITGRSSDTLSSIAKSRIGCLKKKGAAKKIPIKALPKILKATARLKKSESREGGNRRHDHKGSGCESMLSHITEHLPREQDFPKAVC